MELHALYPRELRAPFDQIAIAHALDLRKVLERYGAVGIASHDQVRRRLTVRTTIVITTATTNSASTPPPMLSNTSTDGSSGFFTMSLSMTGTREPPANLDSD